MSQTDSVAKQGNNDIHNESQDARTGFLLQLVILSALVFAFSLIGIWSRPIGALAALWPANAVLLAYLTRVGLSKSVTAYLFSWLSFIAADMVTGSSFAMASLLTLGNLMSVGAGVLYLNLCSQGRIDLSDRSAMFHIILTALIAANAGGLMGMFASPLFFDDTVLTGYLHWSVTEFVNYIAFLPVLFAIPITRVDRMRFWQREISFRHSLPGLITILLTLLVINLNNLNALVLPLLGLLWCAFVYSTFSTAVLTLFYCLQALLIVSGIFSIGVEDLANWVDLMLVRASISAVALVPIAVSLYIQTTRSNVEELSYSVNHKP